MLKLTWSDLFTEDPSLDMGRLIGLWPRTVCGGLRPIGMSAFGDIYFERPSGQVERLDVLQGGVHPVASTREEFASSMNTRQWQEENLLSEGILLLAERGLRRSPQECFAFVPHPMFSGKIDWSRAVVMDAYPWHSICSQLLEGGESNENAT
jgi:hypothetical protein